MLIYDSGIPERNAGTAVPLAWTGAGDTGFAVEAAFYAFGVLAFAALAVTLLMRAQRGRSVLLFALACALTAGWLGVAAAHFWQHEELRAAAFALEAASGLAWLGWSSSAVFCARSRMPLFAGDG